MKCYSVSEKIFMLLALVTAIFLFGAVFANMVYAGDKALRFTWDQVIPSDFAGWHIYQSKTSGDYGETPAFDVPYVSEQEGYNATEVITSPDGEEQTYFFVMTAYDLKRNESVYSNEVNATIDFLGPNNPFSLMIRVQPITPKITSVIRGK